MQPSPTPSPDIKANEDGDGNDAADDDRTSLNKGEFKTAVHAIMKILLSRFDKNGDGRVSREEAKVGGLKPGVVRLMEILHLFEGDRASGLGG